MRVAGVFSELVLGFVAVGLTLTAFGGVPNAGQADAAQAGAGGQTAAIDTPAEPSGQDQGQTLGRWAAPQLAAPMAARPAPAAATIITVPDAASRDAPATVAAAPVTAVRETAVQETAAAPTAPAAPTVPAAAALAADHDAAPGGGTPGLKPAKVLFGAVSAPVPLAARAIGTYAKGCLSGATALPVDGPAWQAMRLSRNRNWGHPKLISLIEKLATEGKAKDGWPGLLVGDIAQPRGGPMLTGHASHQLGLDADIWLTPMPDRTLSREEREKIEATSMLGEDEQSVNRDVWTDGHLKILKRAASYPEVERIFVHPAIKQVLCYTAGTDRGWLSKVRPYWGHNFHFHVRISCPPGSADCSPQKPVPGDDGCGKELDDWLHMVAKTAPVPAPIPIPQPPTVAAKEKRPMTLDQMPAGCRVVLGTDNPMAAADVAAAAKAADKPAQTAAVGAKPASTDSKHAAAGSAATAVGPAAAGIPAIVPALAPKVHSEKKTSTH
jgi:penicillin-insensitive murein DD-endopeptidase